MNKKIILFGAFLSTLILLLTPCIGSVNTNIQNNKNLNIRNINIEDLKNIKERMLNSDCNCKETNQHNDSNGLFSDVLCAILYIMFYNLLIIDLWLWNKGIAPNLEEIIYNMGNRFYYLAEFFECEWIEWL